jgi:hypothetical protein
LTDFLPYQFIPVMISKKKPIAHLLALPHAPHQVLSSTVYLTASSIAKMEIAGTSKALEPHNITSHKSVISTKIPYFSLRDKVR